MIKQLLDFQSFDLDYAEVTIFLLFLSTLQTILNSFPYMGESFSFVPDL